MEYPRQSGQHNVVQLHVPPLFFGVLPVRPLLHNSGMIVPFKLSANHRPPPLPNLNKSIEKTPLTPAIALLYFRSTLHLLNIRMVGRSIVPEVRCS